MKLSETVNFSCFANWLSHLQHSQFSDDKVSKNQRAEECCDRGGDSSESDIKENIKPNELIAQAMEVVHHGELTIVDCELRNASITRSVRARRLPFTSTRSPGAAISPNNSAASAVDSTIAVFLSPASLAA